MTAPRDELAALLARVEAATGEDRKLDAAITAALRIVPAQFALEGWAERWTGPFVGKAERVYLAHTDGRLGVWFVATALTASIDAALALVERVADQITAHPYDIMDEALDDLTRRGWHPNQPLGGQLARSVVASLLTALLQSEAGQGDGAGA